MALSQSMYTVEYDGYT